MRWLAVRREDGLGMLVLGREPFTWSVSRWLPEEEERARHYMGEPARRCYAAPRAGPVLHVDAAQMGLGGASCGPPPHERHVLRLRPMAWHWAVRPLLQGDCPLTIARLLARVREWPR